MPPPRALVLFAPGFEEIETVTVIDVLRRAGVEVVSAGTQAGPLRGSRGIVVTPDAEAADVTATDFDVVILPGGMPNARTLAADPTVQSLLEQARSADRTIAAICAAPVALMPQGLLAGRRYTSHPSVREELPAEGYAEDRVVVDGTLLTSRGPGTALEFALALVEHLLGPAKAREVAGPMLVR